MKKYGFTLIELMIVVAIIVFLAVLAVPQLFHYKAKAYQAEVAMNLASLHTAQQVYFAQHGKYATTLSGEGGLGWKPAGYRGDGKEEGFFYTYGFNSDGAQEGIHYFIGKLKTPKEDLGTTQVTDDSFVVGAAGIVIASKGADVWHMNEQRRLEHVRNGID
jgi:prepilin-type N-terminal cleavage/methylation domain-containing protein